jgi:hypothetical protein
LIFDKKSKKGHSLTNQTKVFWLNVANTGFINFVNFIFRQKSKFHIRDQIPVLFPGITGFDTTDGYFQFLLIAPTTAHFPQLLLLRIRF